MNIKIFEVLNILQIERVLLLKLKKIIENG
jgi:hypothetical protein